LTDWMTRGEQQMTVNTLQTTSTRWLNWAAAVLCALILIAAAPSAHAYVGPGAGLSLLSALWALCATVFAAVLFVLLWPFRRLLRRRRARLAAEAAAGEEPEIDKAVLDNTIPEKTAHSKADGAAAGRR
jgi:membrane protein implicated in regulation of membrane protease activity